MTTVLAPSDADRLAATRRVLLTARIVASNWRTLAEIAAQTCVTTRTVRRDVYALRRLGIDIGQRARVTNGHPTEYRLDRRAWLAVLDLPPGDDVTRSRVACGAPA